MARLLFILMMLAGCEDKTPPPPIEEIPAVCRKECSEKGRSTAAWLVTEREDGSSTWKCICGKEKAR